MKIYAIRCVLILLAFLPFNSDSFIRSSDNNGKPLYLNQGDKLEIAYDLSTLNVSPTLLDSYLEELGTHLLEKLGIQIAFKKGIGGENFTLTVGDKESFFPSNYVAGITQVGFDDSGEIISAHIKLNVNIPVNETKNTYNYFGNVIAHEIGHLLGLDHSTSIYSTMTPHLSPGQYTWEQDDLSGGLKTLGKPLKYSGKVSGVVVGGENDIGIFGVNVDLIDLTNLRVVQSQVTDYYGEFEFVNVDKSKKYILGYGPFEFDTNYPKDLSNSFQGYCHNRESYKYSILASCLPSLRDKPKILTFSLSNELDLGRLGLKCDISSSGILFDYILREESEIGISDRLGNTNNFSLIGLIPEKSRARYHCCFKI